MKIKEIPKDERPREKADALGIESLEDAEVLALLLSSGSVGESALELSRRLLEENGGLYGLRKIASDGKLSERGIKGAKAYRLAAAFEMGRRISLQKGYFRKYYDPKAVAERYLGSGEDEELFAIFLDRQKRIIAQRKIGKGPFLCFSPKQLLSLALKLGAYGLIIVHSHPGGLSLPSAEDIASTREAYKELRKGGVALADHLIVADGGHYSFVEEGIPLTESPPSKKDNKPVRWEIISSSSS